MYIDFLLPAILFSITAISLLLYRRVERKIKSIVEDRKIGVREVVLMVILVSLMVTFIALMPRYLIQILFLLIYSYMLLIFSYIILNKWFLAVFPPAFFIAVYVIIHIMPENPIIIYLYLNLFSTLFAIMVITYMNSLFSWKITLIFAALITIIDFIQVFWTGHMVEAAYKVEELRLPVMVSSHLAKLGLGDVFLSGLLSVQTANKYGLKTGFITAVTISISLLIFETLALNSYIEYRIFPATIIVLLGWLVGVGVRFLKNKWGFK